MTTTQEISLQTEPFVLNMGPLHPSTHGVYRMRVTLDGEVVLDIEPMFGYLHRGIEKLMEERTYTGCIPLTDRLDYASAMGNNLAYCVAVEKLAKIRVPERGEYIRVITAEMIRIANHCLAVGSMLNDAGALGTPFFYLWNEREKLYDLFEMLCGQRVLHNYIRIGGVSQDLPDEFLPALEKFVPQLHKFINEFEFFLKQNEILIARAQGVGVLPKDVALNCGISGPLARASGIKRDLRKDDPYSVYDRFEFDIPTAENGDCYDRYRVRMEEMKQSLHIIDQAIKKVPGGPFRAKVPQIIRPPAGEAYGHIEGPKGELGFYLVSDNSIAPYRCHIRSTSFINLTALRQMVKGWKIADLIVIFGSIDITMGEVDR
ncbi:MAG: NADH-quinone oxidoreductase subunit D [Dehalococcoidales bacterium]|nr:NADH-quinone oxidoreductase subunit D [Dehalococcoidales bacterium]